MSKEPIPLNSLKSDLNLLNQFCVLLPAKLSISLSRLTVTESDMSKFCFNLNNTILGSIDKKDLKFNPNSMFLSVP